jgi:hypothetical protein
MTTQQDQAYDGETRAIVDSRFFLHHAGGEHADPAGYE